MTDERDSSALGPHSRRLAEVRGDPCPLGQATPMRFARVVSWSTAPTVVSIPNAQVPPRGWDGLLDHEPNGRGRDTGQPVPREPDLRGAAGGRQPSGAFVQSVEASRRRLAVPLVPLTPFRFPLRALPVGRKGPSDILRFFELTLRVPAHIASRCRCRSGRACLPSASRLSCGHPFDFLYWGRCH